MTVDEKIGQLRLISVGPDNPKEAIREMIKDGQVGAIFNTVTRQDIRAMQDQVMELSRLKIPLFFAYDVLHGQRTVFPISLGLASSFKLDAVKTVIDAHNVKRFFQWPIIPLDSPELSKLLAIPGKVYALHGSTKRHSVRKA